MPQMWYGFAMTDDLEQGVPDEPGDETDEPKSDVPDDEEQP